MPCRAQVRSQLADQRSDSCLGLRMQVRRRGEDRNSKRGGLQPESFRRGVVRRGLRRACGGCGRSISLVFIAILLHQSAVDSAVKLKVRPRSPTKPVISDPSFPAEPPEHLHTDEDRETAESFLADISHGDEDTMCLRVLSPLDGAAHYLTVQSPVQTARTLRNQMQGPAPWYNLY